MNARRQRGAALIIALVIVALATVLAATLVWENHLARRRTANQLYGAEALAYTLSVEDFVRDVLAQDDRETDHLLEPWAQQGAVFPLDDDIGTVSGSVIDLQGRFNVNNLVDAQGQPVEDAVDDFRALLLSLGLDPVFADRLLDWRDGDIDARTNGAEDDTYLRSTPAYRTANQPIADVSELRLLAEMTPEQFGVLEPYVTALPPSAGMTHVNINTAPPELLVALGADLTAEDAARIIEQRNQDGFSSLAAAQEIVGGNKLPDDIFSVKSDWFQLQVLAVIGSSRVTMYSVLHRDNQTGAVRARSRSLGTP